MDYLAIDTKGDTLSAVRALRRQVTAEGERQRRTLGHQHDHTPGKVNVYWFEKYGFWCSLGRDTNRHWLAFGVNEDPRNGDITVEINPPFEGINRSLGGVFVEAGGQLFLSHNGKVAGGYPGVGKKAFLEWYSREAKTLQWSDGKRTQGFLFGPLGSGEFLRELGLHVCAVADFKRQARQGVATIPAHWRIRRYSPEFVGTSRVLARPTTAVRRHGLVVSALRDHLGHQYCFNDTPRDLYVCDRAGKHVALFEVKSDASSSNIYAGVGQLVLHGARTRGRLKLVLVMPAQPEKNLDRELRGAGIDWLTYRSPCGRVRFDDARGTLASIRKLCEA